MTLTTDNIAPDVALIYILMQRGSVLSETMEQCIRRVHRGADVANLERLKIAKELTAKLWGFDSVDTMES